MAVEGALLAGSGGTEVGGNIVDAFDGELLLEEFGEGLVGAEGWECIGDALARVWVFVSGEEGVVCGVGGNGE